MRRPFGIFASALLLASCAKAVFHDAPTPSAMTYFDPEPYLMVETDRDCTVKTSLFSMPAEKRSVEVTSGIGAADVSISLKNGMIQSLNQKVDTQIPATIGAVAGAASAAKAMAVYGAPACRLGTRLYPIVEGVPDMRHPIAMSGR